MVTKAATDSGVDAGTPAGLDTLQQTTAALMAELAVVREQRDALLHANDELASEWANKVVRPSPSGRGAVITALCEASRRIGPVPKDATMKGGEGYQYRSIRAIMARAQEVFYEVGIVLLPERVIERTVAPYQTKYDLTWRATDTIFEWSINVRSGDYILIQTVGEARDGGDKGANKCQTASYKYALIAALSLAEGHTDSDDEKPEDQYNDGRDEAAKQEPQRPLATPEQLAEFNDLVRLLPTDKRATLKARMAERDIPEKADGRRLADHALLMAAWARELRAEYDREVAAHHAENDALRARNADPNADPPHPTTEEPQVPPQSITELRDQIAQVRRDGTTAAQAGPESDDGPTVSPVEPAATAGPVDDDPPPRSDWVELRCTGNPQHDVRGYVGMQCPKPGCAGLLSDEEPFAHKTITRGDDAPFVSRHKWAPRRGDGRWPGQF